ncbi:two-component regulator propeller domain-containing protein [Ignavibacterium sp.]|uniref:ligand-binding sensor domain-containing protein n=1 Tax=Ignavibacterium sp. TaxID=2651167 RepID=UPI00307EE96B
MIFIKFYLLVLLFSFSVSAQNIAVDPNLKSFSVSDGLSSDNVNWIIQDTQGFIWFATEDGLSRFDGYSFKVYQNKRGNKNSLSSNFIWNISLDRNGNLWIATDAGGLNKFDPVTEKFERFIHDSKSHTSISSGPVTYTLEDNEGKIWVGTWGGGLSVYDPIENSFTNFIHNSNDSTSLSDNRILCIYEDDKKNIWIGTDNGGLNKFDRSSNTFKSNFFSFNTPFKNSISYISKGSDNNLLLGTTEGWIIEFNPETNDGRVFPALTKTNKDVQNIIWNIVKDPEGFYWIATSQEGIYKFYPQQDEEFSDRKRFEKLSGVFEKTAKCVYIDKDDNLWIGSIGGGIKKISRKKKSFFVLNSTTTQGKIKDNFTFSVCEDNYYDLWIGTMTDGVYRYNLKTGKIKNYPPNSAPGGLSGEMMRYIFVDRAGDLWIAPLFGKLNKYNYIKDRFEQIDLDFNKDNPDANLIRVVYEDNEGIFWIGLSGNGGLLKYDKEKKTFTRYKYAKLTNHSINLTDILSIKEDNIGNLLIGTYGFGMFIFNKSTESFSHYRFEENNLSSLPDNTIPEIFIDSEQNIWLATYSGLSKYNPDLNNFSTYTKDDGLPSNSIFAILEDHNSNLWLSTSNGISKFDKKNKVFYNFDFSQGVQQGDFLAAARCKLKDGRMFFGGNNGLTYFHPDSVNILSSAPVPVFTAFKVFNNEVALQRSIIYTDTITVDYFDNMFSFEFSSLEFDAPQKIKYAYMLEGLDKEWIQLGNKRTATFTHLSPGEYTLKVKSSDIFGTWNEKFKKITLIVTPPFWMTWWFRGIIILMFLSTGPIIYYKRVKQLKKEKQLQVDFSRQLIHSQEEERKRIASELHDSIGQDLLVIKNLALLNKKKDDQFDEISKIAGDAIDDVRRISYNLHPHQIDRLGLTKAITSMFNNIKQISKINFEINIDNVDGLFNKEKEINIFRIIQECANNIVKHSEAAEAKVKIKLSDNKLLLKISDNGKGFNIEVVKSESFGFGLRNLENRVSLLNGEMNIESTKNGTEVNITLPINR